MFGRSVYVDGDRILVGGDGDDSLRGSAYLFLRSGTSFIEASKLTASDAAMSDYFGGSLSLSGDTALIAAIGDDDHGELSGSAYVFVLVGGPCDADVDCASAHCVEGVCCDATCSSPCDVCTEALGAATDGRCAVAPAGYPGSPACAPQACTGASAACGACTGSSDCPPDRYCASSGGCLLRKDRGEPCR
jgi:hypothetical protein